MKSGGTGKPINLSESFTLEPFANWMIRNRSVDRESFDLDQDFGAVSQIIWFRSGLRRANHESFDLDQDLGAGSWIF